jgi:alginate O-acetyltransferase complex protein AlgI
VGLSKKLLIADTTAVVADAAFALPGSDLTFASAWLGALAYSVQIYFDFSGYSDMAIGMGQMFGIRFLENFNHPYAASTITEFWRRWHISLSTWFRDYLFIPLGGSRVGEARTYLNLSIVFLATGIWHGAAWTFALWGMWHGGFLVLERIVFKGKAAAITSPALRLFYFFPVVIGGWVLFRASDVPAFVTYFRAMSWPFSAGAFTLPGAMLLALSPLAILVLAVAACSILFQGQLQPLGVALSKTGGGLASKTLRLGFVAAASVTCAVFALPANFSPFLYFRF